MIATIVPGIQVLIPYYTKHDNKSRLSLLSKVSRINLLFTSILLAIVILLSIYVIPFLYGEEFRESVYPFILICFGAFFLLVRNVFASFNVAINKQEINLRSNIIALIITVVLDIFLIPKLGIIGACYASIVAYFVSCLYVSIVTIKYSDMPISKFLFINKSDLVFIHNLIMNKIFSKK
jgi:O-antigen/teichoic acid export membrane protein